jgi:hypothetical protein
MTNKSYRCYFADGSDRTQSDEQIECPDDAAAVLKVEELLAASKHKTAELWQGSRLVGKWGTSLGDTNLKQQSPPKEGA